MRRTSLPPPIAGCDTIVAQAPASASGHTIFGKNSDRPPGEAQTLKLVPPAQHAADARVRCQYVDVPQVRETARVLGCGPTWLWGLEMGLNEHGVAIGNETIFAREAPAAIGLLGMDLVRLGLERGRTAAGALQIVIDLIEAHGQGGSGYRDMDWPYNNSFLIADPGEAWILEAAGRHWAARPCGDVDSISNQVSIGCDWARLGAATEARGGELSTTSTDRFDFALAYRDLDAVPRALSEGRLRRSRSLLAEGRVGHSRASLRAILADHDATGPRFVRGATPDQEQFFTLCMHQGPSCTAASMIATLERDPAGARVAWLALGRPCASVYVPLLLAGELPETLARAGDERVGEAEGLWWTFERLAAHAERSVACADRIEATFATLGEQLASDFASLQAQIVGASASEVDARATRHASDVAARVADEARGLDAACSALAGTA